MPELPEVETVKSGLVKAWTGKTIAKVILRRENLRYPFPENFAKQLEGQTITGIRRRAKYLLIDTDGDLVFLSHLGMSGKYTIFDAEQVSQHDLSGPDNKSVFGEKTGFGAGNVGGKFLKDYYFHGEDHRFRGRPRFMCTMAKDISSLNGPNHKGYKHFPRKTCELDMTHPSCTGDGANGCTECKNSQRTQHDFVVYGRPSRAISQ